MTEHGKRICRLAEEAANADDPESALRTLSELRRELDDFVGVHVQRALAAGRSFGDVARVLGISRQAAHRRYRDLAPPRRRRVRRLVATDAARRVVRLAEAEAVASAVTTIGSREVLLGVLRADGEAARLLRSQGITYERIRAARAEADTGDGRGSVRRILRNAGRLAVAKGDGRLKPEQILIAALSDPDGGAGRAVTGLGVTEASIRARLGF